MYRKNKNHNVHKKGRPTRKKQIEIQKTLRPYFERGITASLAAEKTGINIKTVCNYFDEWVEQINEFETSSFYERHIAERERANLAYSNLILAQYKSLDEINDEIRKCKKENKPVPRHLLGFKLEHAKFIAALTEKKSSLAMQPTIDEVLDKKIEEKIKQYGKS